MKTKIYLFVGLLIVSLIGVITYQKNVIKKTKAEKEIYQSNNDALLSDIKRYKTKDSLDAVSVKKIELTLLEYEMYRASDMQTIKKLQIDNKRLQSINTTNTETIYQLKTQAKDTIIQRVVETQIEPILDTLKCVNINTRWLSFNGCINKENQFTGDIATRDKITCIEHIVPKRFLFFKWGVKSRQLEVVSDNPHTKIVDAEFITIRK